MSEETGTYQVTGKKTFSEMLDSPEMEEFRQAMRESEEQYKKDVETFWNNLSYDDKLKAFFYVCSGIHKADVEDRGTYRHCLYSVFSFLEDSYMIGMDARYMDLHNYIFEGVEFSKFRNAEEIELQNGDDIYRINVPKKRSLDFTFDKESNKLTIKTKNWMEVL